jgi:membrane protein DedA with SNARE-associated domain
LWGWVSDILQNKTWQFDLYSVFSCFTWSSTFMSLSFPFSDSWQSNWFFLLLPEL